jgi:hypothetical protein
MVHQLQQAGSADLACRVSAQKDDCICLSDPAQVEAGLVLRVCAAVKALVALLLHGGPQPIVVALCSLLGRVEM